MRLKSTRVRISNGVPVHGSYVAGLAQRLPTAGNGDRRPSGGNPLQIGTGPMAARGWAEDERRDRRPCFASLGLRNQLTAA